MDFELSNDQRLYFGLDPIEESWDRVILKGDQHRPNSILYFDGDTIKRQITSTDNKYHEIHWNEQTRDREVLLPKTNKGKEKKLSGSTLESKKPMGVYLLVTKYGNGLLTIGNFSTETTFYSSDWEPHEPYASKNIGEIIRDFISTSPSNHIKDVSNFKASKKKHVAFKSGDYFTFKLNRTRYGFGRILLDIHKVRESGAIDKEHGMHFIMGKPVLVQFFVYSSESKQVSVAMLDSMQKLPSDLMMDNVLYYGEYEIIGHRDLTEDEFDFPVSYGRSIRFGDNNVVLQWGLINKRMPVASFDKFLNADNPFVEVSGPSRSIHNPFNYLGIGFRPAYGTLDVWNALSGTSPFSHANFKNIFDLRNPKNESIGRELLAKFDLDPDTSYMDNCKRTRTMSTIDVIKKCDD